MWNGLVAISLMLGGWWMQNTWNATLKLQEQMLDNGRHVESVYVTKEVYRQMDADQNRRFNSIENKLDQILSKMSSRDGL